METKIHIDFNWPIALAGIFAVLKLIGIINWSWVWILSPIWISIGGVAVLLLIWLVFKKVKERNNRW